VTDKLYLSNPATLVSPPQGPAIVHKLEHSLG
jgi:hypothetical protein